MDLNGSMNVCGGVFLNLFKYKIRVYVYYKSMCLTSVIELSY